MKKPYFFQDPSSNVMVLPRNESLVIDSHGSKIYGCLLLPGFDDLNSTCPVVLMLHGYPGNEKNIDLAQLLRMAGYAVVYFSYRGVWGSHGEYAFTHLIEDTKTVADYIRATAANNRIDPDQLYLLGHSMGGFAAINAMAAGLKAAGAILMAPCDAAGKYLYNKKAFETLMKTQDQGYFNTSSRDSLENEVREHAEEWLFVNAAQKLDTNIQYRFIGGALDTATPPETHIYPILETLNQLGAKVDYWELCDGHNFPASRMQLAEHIVNCIEEMRHDYE